MDGSRKKVVHFENGKTHYYEATSIPGSYGETMKEILDTAIAVNGEKFGNMVKILVNLRSVIGMALELSKPGHLDSDRKALKELLVTTSEQMANLMIALSGLDEEKVSEVIRTAELLNKTANQFGKTLEK